MNIQDLIYFVSVVDNASYTKTAQEFNITQPALTKVFRRLGEELGTPIVEPRSKGVHLTRTGEILLQHARTIIAEENITKSEIWKEMNKNRIFHIASCDPGPSLYLRQVVGNEYFHIDLNLEKFTILTAAINDLKNEKVDIIITSQLVEDAALDCIFFGRDSLCLTVNNTDVRFAKLEEISLTDERINAIHYLDMKGDFSLKVHPVFSKLCANKTMYRETDYISLLTLMKAKPVFSFITRMVRSLRPEENRRARILTEEGLDINYYLVYKKEDAERLGVVIDLVKQIAKQFA